MAMRISNDNGLADLAYLSHADGLSDLGLTIEVRTLQGGVTGFWIIWASKF